VCVCVCVCRLCITPYTLVYFSSLHTKTEHIRNVLVIRVRVNVPNIGT
jgi:hypothetical protein